MVPSPEKVLSALLHHRVDSVGGGRRGPRARGCSWEAMVTDPLVPPPVCTSARVVPAPPCAQLVQLGDAALEAVSTYARWFELPPTGHGVIPPGDREVDEACRPQGDLGIGK